MHDRHAMITNSYAAFCMYCRPMQLVDILLINSDCEIPDHNHQLLAFVLHQTGCRPQQAVKSVIPSIVGA